LNYLYDSLCVFFPKILQVCLEPGNNFGRNVRIFGGIRRGVRRGIHWFFHRLDEGISMKKLIGMLAVSAMAATFAGCNSSDRASAEAKEVKVAGASCSEGKATACCSTNKVAMAKSEGSCSDKTAMAKSEGSCSDKTAMAKSGGSCSDKAASCGEKSVAKKN